MLRDFAALNVCVVFELLDFVVGSAFGFSGNTTAISGSGIVFTELTGNTRLFELLTHDAKFVGTSSRPEPEA